MEEPTTLFEQVPRFSVQGPRERLSPVHVEVLLDIDITASSGPFQQGIGKLCTGIVAAASKKVAKSTFRLMTHGDEEFEHAPLLVVEKLTIDSNDSDSLQRLQSALDRISFYQGQDLEETHLQAIQWALERIPFTSHDELTRRFIVQITTDDTKPLRVGSPKDLGEQLTAAGIELILITTPNAINLRSLAEFTRSEIFDISKEPSTEDLAVLARCVVRSITAPSCSLLSRTLPIGDEQIG